MSKTTVERYVIERNGSWQSGCPSPHYPYEIQLVVGTIEKDKSFKFVLYGAHRRRQHGDHYTKSSDALRDMRKIVLADIGTLAACVTKPKYVDHRPKKKKGK